MTTIDYDEFARKLFDSLPAGEHDTTRSMVSDDFKVVQKLSGFKTLSIDDVCGLVSAIKNITTFKYANRVVTETSKGFVAEHSFTATLEDGTVIDAPVCCVCTINDEGKCTEIQEYLDSALVAPLLALLAPPPETDEKKESE